MARLLTTDKLWWNVMGHIWLPGAQVLDTVLRAAPVLTLALQTPGRNIPS